MIRRSLLKALCVTALPSLALAATQRRPSDADHYKAAAEEARTRMQYATDQQVWGVDDYWATPEETLALGLGDCEDYALLVNYLAQLRGVKNVQLAVCRVRDTRLAHAVSVFNRGELVADVLNTDILPLSSRPDLEVLLLGEIRPQDIPRFKRPATARHQ